MEHPALPEIDYTGWKGWDQASFGTLQRGDAHYFRREVREAVAGTASPRVLEFGFGHGQFLEFCRQEGWDVSGVELLPELVDAANRAGFVAVRHDATDDLPDAAFDVAAAFDVLEHIDPAMTVDFLIDIRDKLRPGGYMVLRFPNGDSWLGNPFQNGDPTHTNAMGVLKAKYYAHEAGLELARFRAVSRRGFETSVVHGVHKWTAGLWIRLSAAVRRAIYFPDLPVVLSNGNVVCVLRKPEEPAATASPAA